MALPHDEQLAAHGAKKLLELYLEARTSGREINAKGAGADRKAWQRAEKAAVAELKKLVAAHAEPSAVIPADPPDIKGHERDVLGTCFGLLKDKLTAAGVDCSALEDKLEALDESLAYSDGEMDETHVPPQGERILELAERAKKARADERKKKKNPPPVRGESEPLRNYSPRETFHLGEWLTHVKFGEGQVIEDGTRIKVRFLDAERQLVHVPPPSTEFKPIEISAPKPKTNPIIHNVPITRVAPDPRLTEDQDTPSYGERAKPAAPEPDAEPSVPAPDES